MVEKEVEIESKGSNLSGTICLPEDKGRFPFVLMIHGSGPLDRDENMASQKLNIFNSIAYHLASVGIASLRYDKRRYGKSSGSYYKASHFDFVEDERTAKRRVGIDKPPPNHRWTWTKRAFILLVPNNANLPAGWEAIRLCSGVVTHESGTLPMLITL